MKSISVQYQELKEGKINRHQFLRNARMMFPNFVTNHNSFDDSVKILKNKGLLNEGDAVKGTPDKAPSYDYPTQPAKYKKVVQEPEVDEQDGIYPATTVTDIPKEEVSKPIKSKNRPDGLEPIKPNDTKNEMKKVRIVKESKKNLTEANVTPKQIQDKYNEMFGKNPQTTFSDVAKALGVSEQDIAVALFTAPIFEAGSASSIKSAAKKGMSTGDYSELDALVLGKPLKETEDDKKKDKSPSLVPGTSVKMSPQAQDKIKDFLGQFRSAGASAPGESANKLKDKIKEMLHDFINEYEEGDESDEAPSVPGVIDMIVKAIINDIESNDLNLEFNAKDIEDELNNFQDKIGHRYSDDQFEAIIDGAVAELKKQGYNIK
jgi:DNA-binding Lrp family transcriptional regulator